MPGASKGRRLGGFRCRATALRPCLQAAAHSRSSFRPVRLALPGSSSPASSKNLTLHAGYNHGKMPINRQNTYFNILAPATVERHVTLGATWTLADKSELSLNCMHAFSKGIAGVSNGNGQSVAGYPVDPKMKQNTIHHRHRLWLEAVNSRSERGEGANVRPSGIGGVQTHEKPSGAQVVSAARQHPATFARHGPLRYACVP